MNDQQRDDDRAARERARRHLVTVLGDDQAVSISWDPEYHLQGHVDVAGEHLVVIAARDSDHQPLVLSEADWDALRRGCMTAA